MLAGPDLGGLLGRVTAGNGSLSLTAQGGCSPEGDESPQGVGTPWEPRCPVSCALSGRAAAAGG